MIHIVIVGFGIVKNPTVGSLGVLAGTGAAGDGGTFAAVVHRDKSNFIRGIMVKMGINACQIWTASLLLWVLRCAQGKTPAVRFPGLAGVDRADFLPASDARRDDQIHPPAPVEILRQLFRRIADEKQTIFRRLTARAAG